MLRISPTLVLLKKDGKTVSFTVDSEYTDLSLSLVSLSKENGTLSKKLCNQINFAVKQGKKVTLDQQFLINDIQNCNTNHKSFAIEVSPKVKTPQQISSYEAISLLIVDESKDSLLEKQTSMDVLGELATTYQLSELTCDKQLTFHQTEVACEMTVTNTSETPVMMNFISQARESIFSHTTIYENLERTSTILLPAEPYALKLYIPKEKLPQGRYVISGKAVISMIGNPAQSYVNARETSFTYVPIPTLIIFLLLLVFLSVILIKSMYNFVFQLRHE